MNGGAARPPRLRLDQLVLARELAPSRQQAQALILAGQILVEEQKLTKPGQMVSADAALRRLGEPPRFASRAGLKLEAALDHFQIDVHGRVALDIGSSTGGFTDCLLQRGAARVHAVDSGSNQMIWRLRTDPRVHLREKTNARYLDPAAIGEPISLLTVDVSFISVTLLLPAIIPLLAPPADIVILVKPQFEAGRAQVGKGGIVRDESIRLAAVERVRSAVTSAGAVVRDVLPSPVLGADGNQEYLLYGVLP
ncbi:MAG TPA: TlyA family RNA methyltransferase [Terriglobales bacterium]|nr:TlyA family RNA methyltransferase [Terriglobales bacterium]